MSFGEGGGIGAMIEKRAMPWPIMLPLCNLIEQAPDQLGCIGTPGSLVGGPIRRASRHNRWRPWDGSHSAGFTGKRPPPINPVRRQQSQANGNEELLEVEEANRRPVAVALQHGPDFSPEVQVNDRPQQRGGQVQNDDGIGERHRLSGLGSDGAPAAVSPARITIPGTGALIDLGCACCSFSRSTNLAGPGWGH